MKLILDPKSLDNNDGNGGLEIVIKGYVGDPGAIFIEKYKGKVQAHVWNSTEQDPQTIIFKPISKETKHA